jgi:hypothetical protein
MLSYIIQTLSAEHAFGLQLTFPIKSAYIPTKWNVGGATADFFINVRVFSEFNGSVSDNDLYRPSTSSSQPLRAP